MHKEILRYLTEHNSEVELINKLITSLFVITNNIAVNNNQLVKHLIIEDDGLENKILKEFICLFEKHENAFDFGKLIQLFEHAIPAEDRTLNGIVYTPKFIKSYIVNEIFDYLEVPISEAKFCDISCGCGGFLYTIAKKLKNSTGKTYFEIFKQNLWGLDIKSYSIERAKILLSLLAISEEEDHYNFDFNLFVGNALNFNWYERSSVIHQNEGFDGIVGNPPYVTLRNIEDESKKLLSNWSVAQGGNTDLYIPFFEIGIKNLRETGVLGYITANTFFRSLNARSLRRFFHAKSLELKIIDFGNEQIFGSKSTYTCLCFIKKHKSKNIHYAKGTVDQIQSIKKLKFNKIAYKSLDHLRGWLLCSSRTLKNLKYIESTGTRLDKKYKMRTGLATLANHIYIFKPIKEDKTYYYLKQWDTTFPIEKAICKDVINPNKIKNEKDLSIQMEKIIFPYLKSEHRIELFNEDYFRANFHKAYEYLQSKQHILAQRDKCNGNYENWYAFGRTQSLFDRGYKLLFPHITTRPYFVFTSHLDLLFYNGHAIYAESKKELIVLKKILESKIFDYYINNASKPYNNGYFSLSKNYIKHFGICELTSSEREFLLHCDDRKEIDELLFSKYNFHSSRVDMPILKLIA